MARKFTEISLNIKKAIQKEQIFNYNNTSMLEQDSFLSILGITLGQPPMLGHQKVSQFQRVDDKVYCRIF